jgi:hypothetical protein
MKIPIATFHVVNQSGDELKKAELLNLPIDGNSLPLPRFEDIAVLFPEHEYQVNEYGRAECEKTQIDKVQSHALCSYTQSFAKP